MNLLPREFEKLSIHHFGFLAQKRLARGLRLNHPETIALISNVILEKIRDGDSSVAQLMDLGRRVLGKNQVQDGVPELIREIQIEGTFPDGTKLVTVHHPIVTENGDLKLALYGSFLPVPDISAFNKAPVNTSIQSISPVGNNIFPLLVKPGYIILNRSRTIQRLEVTNLCDRPIQVGSHYHFIETNPLLSFDRALAYGMRLNIPAGTAVRFEPGEKKTVTLVEIGGRKIIKGGNNVATGKYDPKRIAEIVNNLIARGFNHSPQNITDSVPPSVCQLDRFDYAQRYGPTTGDRVQLGDTNLVVEIERDYAVHGEEIVFGGGKVIREGMGQMVGCDDNSALDLVITNVVVIDYSGIFKADIGIKNGRIIGIGKGGNPDCMEGIYPANMIVGVTTEVISGEGKILTAGGIDTHIHFICPQQALDAISTGITTLIGGGSGPATGTCATTCSPGSSHIRFMLEATDSIPLNFGFTGKGNTSSPEGLLDQIEAGAIGLKLHEDWGTTPAAIDCCLKIADKTDTQVTIHTDTLNESSCVEHTVKAIAGRTIHSYHTEGAGGGHAPDIIKICGEPNVLPSSTNPTRPYTANTVDEHVDMLMVCHHLDKNIPGDVAFAESRIRATTIAAEDILHDLGAISIMGSDSQAMGRIGEVITRTWQTAAKMKAQRGKLDVDLKTENDNFRIKRYIAKYTINPAIAHGIGHVIGSVEAGKIADLVLWQPAFFGTKPDMVLKGGFITYAQMGDPNASIPTPELVHMRPMFGANTRFNSIAFVSKLSIENEVVTNYGLQKSLIPVQNCRFIKKSDMKLNDLTPKLDVDPETFQVFYNGQELTCQPATTLPLTQRFLFF